MPSPPSPQRPSPDPAFDIDAPPRVAGRTSLWPVTFGILGAMALGVIVFLQLEANRLQSETVAPQAPLTEVRAAAPPAPRLAEPVADTPPPSAPPPELIPLVETPPPPPPPEVMAGPTQAEIDRLRAPALVVDLSVYAAPGSRPGEPGAAAGAPGDARGLSDALSAAANQGLSADERFAQRFGVGGQSRPARASRLADLSTTIIEGSVIAAVLETALNSDLPGYVRAVVTRDVRGFDGSKILVPRGARLIGQYKSGVALGQSRTFVIWTRMIRPDGVAIDLSSPATDGLGRGGLDGDVDTHFFERFGGAVLLSLLNLGVGAAFDAGDTSIVVASTRAGVDAGASALTSGVNISPTVTVPQGSPVRVFVSQDLDFSSVGPVVSAGSSN